MSIGMTIFLILAALQAVVVIIAWKTKLLEPFRLSAYGPFIMWRTERGKGIVDWFARAKKFWLGFGWFAIGLTFVAMGLMFGLLLWIATIVPLIPASEAPSFRLILGIPGLNPVIPLWQGILGLAVGIVVHELAHGIMTRAQGLRLKSMGLLFAWIPMGAFAEPDEQELTTTQKRNRMRVYAVGPASNIILAIVCAALFCTVVMGSLEPVHDAPAALREGQFDWGEQLLSVDGTAIRDTDDIDALSFAPGTNLTAETYLDGKVRTRNVTAGLCVVGLFEEGPAEAANISAGWLIVTAGNVTVWNHTQFTDMLDVLSPGATLNLTFLEVDSWRFYERSVVLADLYEWLADNYAGSEKEDDRGKAFMGVYLHYLDGPFANPDAILSIYTNPFAAGPIFGPLTFIGLPLQQYSPIPEPIQVMFEPSGALGILPEWAFYVLADALYWIFWISIMLGLTNALPAVPLDGGVVFGDAADHLLVKAFPRYDKAKREKIIGTLVLGMALFVLALVVWQFLGPRIFPFLSGFF